MSVLLFFVLPGIQSLCLSVIGFWESQIPPSFMLMNYWASRESSQSGWKSDDEFTKEKIHWHEQRCFSFFFLPPNTHAVEDKYNHAMLSVSVVWFSLFLLHKWQTGIEYTVDKAFVLNKKHTHKKILSTPVHCVEHCKIWYQSDPVLGPLTSVLIQINN